MSRTALQLILAALSAAVATVSPGAAAADYPTKPIKIVVPYGAGGPTDTITRIVAQKMSESMGQPIVIDNKAGASGNIGMEAVAKAEADGYTLAAPAANNLVTNQFLFKTLGHDPLKAFTPLSIMAAAHNVLVVSHSVNARDLPSLIAYVKANPGKATYASAAVGSQGHLGMESLMKQTGIKMTHVVYKGAVAALTDVARGEVTMTLAQAASAMPLVQAGKLRAIAVASLKRAPNAPDVPTFSEQGYPGFEAVSWFGLVAPAGVPTSVATRLNQEIVKALALPEVRQVLVAQGTEPIGNSQQEFAARIEQESKKWGKIISDASIQAN